MCIYVYMYMYICIYIYVCIYICVYVYTNISFIRNDDHIDFFQ